MTDAAWNFDWVSARSRCSATDNFAVLAKEARVNMVARNQILDESGDGKRFQFKEHPRAEPSFTIWDTWARKRTAVDFTLIGSAIEIIRMIDETPNPPLHVTMTVNDKGECKFQLGDDEVDAWQVLKRALEALFFEEPQSRR